MLREIAARQMQARQHLADFDAVRGRGRQFGRAFELRHDGRGLAVEFGEERAVAARHRIGHRHAMRCEMAHQVEVERQLRGAQVLEDREDVLAVRRGQEEVAVLDARRDAAKFGDIAEIVVLQPVFELGRGDRSKYGHAGNVVRLDGWLVQTRGARRCQSGEPLTRRAAARRGLRKPSAHAAGGRSITQVNIAGSTTAGACSPCRCRVPRATCRRARSSGSACRNSTAR